jgi:threonine/homoserine/homoserine lactone efflux protein
MPDPASLWLFVIPFAIAAALPGPAQGALVAQVLARGGRSCVPFIVGMVAGNAAWLLAAIFGLSVIALRFELVFEVIKWLGIAYLLFIAVMLWRAPAEDLQGDAGGRSGLVSGALLTLGNPKAVVFFGSVLPHAFDMTALSGAEIGFITVLGILIDMSVQLVYLTAASRARGLIRSPRGMRIVNRSAAGLMAGSAAAIAARG